jgi:hypothetical protein
MQPLKSAKFFLGKVNSCGEGGVYVRRKRKPRPNVLFWEEETRRRRGEEAENRFQLYIFTFYLFIQDYYFLNSIRIQVFEVSKVPIQG